MDNKEFESLMNQIKDIENKLNDGDDTFMSDLNNIISLLNPKESNLVTSIPVKIKKLHYDALIPTYAKEGDAGLDLSATQIIDNSTAQVTYGTGLAIEIPYGYVGLIFPRSSIKNYELVLSNSVGILDSGYRGELRAVFNKTNGIDSLKYKIGDRIAQILILPYPKINFVLSDELSDTERGTGGYGSTGI